ncbi:MAG: cation diffusion facilitator family transporter [Bacteroidales bacterium]|jgi:cobalt-zinc-cadmium efflux system protein|nr:cation diffusion facilitator family transporter [Bacteroidales bacterium]
MAHNHNHSHSTSVRKSNIGLAFFLNLSFTFVELIGGFLTNSVAILSDAVHDLGDSFSLALAWYFEKLSKRGRTVRFSYGYKRFSLIGAIINSVVLIVGSIYIISEAVPRLLSPQETNAKGMLMLAVLGVVVNGVAVLRTRKTSSINERMVSLHLLEDALGWVAVLIGSVVMYFTGWTVIDPILSIAIACFVLFNVYKNIHKVLPVLLQGTPADIDPVQIERVLKALDSISEVHDMHIWSLDEIHNILTAHIVVVGHNSMEHLAMLKLEVRSVLAQEGITHATLEFEFSGEVCGCMCN